jgi:rubrerythrin
MQRDVGLLAKFTPQRLDGGFACLNATARQVPAGDVGMPHQQHAVVFVEHDGANAKGHAARKARVEVEGAPHQPLAPTSPNRWGAGLGHDLTLHVAKRSRLHRSERLVKTSDETRELVEAGLKRFSELSEQEVLALAISNEEDDSRIYHGFAQGLEEKYPDSAAIFRDMAEQEVRHRTELYNLYREKFGEYLPLIRKQDVSGFIKRKPLWLTRPLGLDEVRKYAAEMELETARFYRRAAERARDVSVRELLVKLAEEEDQHEAHAEQLTENMPQEAIVREAETERRLFVLQYVQPGLAGLMDGSVSTLAPLFAAAFATHQPFATFLVGLAASIGAGISMGFAEALSDDGSLTGRGSPVLRGAVCGLMTALGGLGHTLPYLIPDFWTATVLAIIVVAIELAVISWIRHRYMDTPWLQAAFQIVVGGTLVFIAGILIGSA